MNNLLTPEDSKRVADAIIHQIRQPKYASDGGIGAVIATEIGRAVSKSLGDALFTGFRGNLGEKIVEVIHSAVNKP